METEPVVSPHQYHLLVLKDWLKNEASIGKVAVTLAGIPVSGGEPPRDSIIALGLDMAFTRSNGIKITPSTSMLTFAELVGRLLDSGLKLKSSGLKHLQDNRDLKLALKIATLRNEMLMMAVSQNILASKLTAHIMLEDDPAVPRDHNLLSLRILEPFILKGARNPQLRVKVFLGLQMLLSQTLEDEPTTGLHELYIDCLRTNEKNPDMIKAVTIPQGPYQKPVQTMDEPLITTVCRTGFNFVAMKLFRIDSRTIMFAPLVSLSAVASALGTFTINEIIQ